MEHHPGCKRLTREQLIALRYNDLRDKTTLSGEVQEKYVAAWKSKGMVQEDGRFIMWYSPKQDSKTLARDIGSTAWYVSKTRVALTPRPNLE